MFAYLIIGFELVILYFVFWVVFIREPQPREIRAELWGRYEGIQKILNPQPRISRKIRLPRQKARRHKTHHCFCMRHEKKVAIKRWKDRSIEINSKDSDNRELAEKLLLVLNRTLNKLSVKIPTLDP